MTTKKQTKASVMKLVRQLGGGHEMRAHRIAEDGHYKYVISDPHIGGLRIVSLEGESWNDLANKIKTLWMQVDSP